MESREALAIGSPEKRNRTGLCCQLPTGARGIRANLKRYRDYGLDRAERELQGFSAIQLITDALNQKVLYTGQ